MKRNLTFILLISPAILIAPNYGCTPTLTSEQKKEEQTIDPRAVKKGENVLNLVTYNVGVFNKSGFNSMYDVVMMMKTLNLDAISLNELDSCNTRSGRGVYQLKDFADEMGKWNYNFGGAIAYKEGSYGIGVATPHKVLNKWTIKLPKSDDKEVRALMVVETEKFVFCSTHLGLTEKAREDQIQVINSFTNEHFAKYGKPVFLCGDMNAEPQHAPIGRLEEYWEILNDKDSYTFSTSKPVKCIDYILHLKGSKACRVVRSFVGRDLGNGAAITASDHFPVFVQVELN